MEEEKKFTWINFYMEFADRLLEYKNNRTGLVNKIITIFDNIDLKLPLLETNNDITDIGPFTIFGLFNKNIKTENKIKILKEIKESFSLKADLPTDFKGVPELNPVNSTFYYFKGYRGDKDIDNLWDLFEIALKYSENKSPQLYNEFVKIYNTVLNQVNIKWNITMGLFWIRPYEYISLNSRTRWYLTNPNFVNDEIINRIKPSDKSNTPPKGEEYLKICNYFKEIIKNNDYEFKNFPELIYISYIESVKDDELEKEYKEKKKIGDGIGDSNINNDGNYWLYSPGQGAFAWEKFRDKNLMGIGWEAVGNLKEYTSKKEIESKLQEINNSKRKFPNDALALWEFANKIKIGDVVFAKRVSHEIIAYGIVKGKYFFDKSIDENFPNFIEIKWKEEINTKTNFYLPTKTLTRITDYEDMLNNIKNLFEDDIEPEKPSNEKLPIYTKEEFLEESFISEEMYDNLVNLIRYKMNVIIEGAPGVGKTFTSKRLAYSIIGVKDKERVELIQFHQSYSYEDFIMGYRPTQNGFSLENGVFYNFCKKAEEDEDNDYFFIIDEINRGNLSKIFGELFMLIEKDKRGNKVRLLYNGELFSIPKNLYIIGLMNTADRSLAMIDYALRRRFAFYTLKPAFDSENFIRYQKSLNNPKFDNVINLVKELNDEIKNDEVLGEGFQIGHSYFCNLDEKTIDKKLDFIINFEIIPLLKEYWFDEVNKVETWSNRLKNAVV